MLHHIRWCGSLFNISLEVFLSVCWTEAEGPQSFLQLQVSVISANKEMTFKPFKVCPEVADSSCFPTGLHELLKGL